MRGMVVLVSIMSLLLIGGMALLAYGLATRGGISSTPAREMQALSLPVSAVVEHMSVDNDKLALHVKSPDGQFIYFYNAKQGKLEGRLALVEGK